MRCRFDSTTRPRLPPTSSPIKRPPRQLPALHMNPLAIAAGPGFATMDTGTRRKPFGTGRVVLILLLLVAIAAIAVFGTRYVMRETATDPSNAAS